MGVNGNKRILIVEDSPDLQFLLKQFFESEGCDVTCANNGQEALDFLKSSRDGLPAVILLDLMMPIMDGFQFREEQFRDEKIAQIPVVIMTANGQLRSQDAKLKAASYFKKPADIRDLEQVMEHYFSSPKIQ